MMSQALGTALITGNEEEKGWEILGKVIPNKILENFSEPIPGRLASQTGWREMEDFFEESCLYYPLPVSLSLYLQQCSAKSFDEWMVFGSHLRRMLSTYTFCFRERNIQVTQGLMLNFWIIFEFFSERSVLVYSLCGEMVAWFALLLGDSESLFQKHVVLGLQFLKEKTKDVDLPTGRGLPVLLDVIGLAHGLATNKTPSFWEGGHSFSEAVGGKQPDFEDCIQFFKQNEDLITQISSGFLSGQELLLSQREQLLEFQKSALREIEAVNQKFNGVLKQCAPELERLSKSVLGQYRFGLESFIERLPILETSLNAFPEITEGMVDTVERKYGGEPYFPTKDDAFDWPWNQFDAFLKRVYLSRKILYPKGMSFSGEAFTQRFSDIVRAAPYYQLSLKDGKAEMVWHREDGNTGFVSSYLAHFFKKPSDHTGDSLRFYVALALCEKLGVVAIHEDTVSWKEPKSMPQKGRNKSSGKKNSGSQTEWHLVLKGGDSERSQALLNALKEQKRKESNVLFFSIEKNGEKLVVKIPKGNNPTQESKNIRFFYAFMAKTHFRLKPKQPAGQSQMFPGGVSIDVFSQGDFQSFQAFIQKLLPKSIVEYLGEGRVKITLSVSENTVLFRVGMRKKIDVRVSLEQAAEVLKGQVFSAWGEKSSTIKDTVLSGQLKKTPYAGGQRACITRVGKVLYKFHPEAFQESVRIPLRESISCDISEEPIPPEVEVSSEPPGVRVRKALENLFGSPLQWQRLEDRKGKGKPRVKLFLKKSSVQELQRNDRIYPLPNLMQILQEGLRPFEGISLTDDDSERRWMLSVKVCEVDTFSKCLGQLPIFEVTNSAERGSSAYPSPAALLAAHRRDVSAEQSASEQDAPGGKLPALKR